MGLDASTMELELPSARAPGNAAAQNLHSRRTLSRRRHQPVSEWNSPFKVANDVSALFGEIGWDLLSVKSIQFGKA